MGPNRNSKVASTETKDAMPEWDNKTVCKNFLVGFCCHDWFTLTKRQLPSCSKIHSEVLRSQFEAAPNSEVFRAEYEEDFLVYLEQAARDCDAFIARERLKCRAASGKVVKMPPEVKERHDRLESHYKDLIEKAEVLADESVTRSQEMMKQAMEVKEELDSIKAKHTTEFAGEDICEVCGVRYPLGDGAHDKESHKRGKTHGGFAQIRNKIVELKAKRRSWDKMRDKIRANIEKRRTFEEKERKEQREKERERQAEIEREREAMERARPKPRSPSPRRARSRSRDRRRSRSRDRRKGRKDRSRSRSASGRRKKDRRDDEKNKGKNAKRSPSRSWRQRARSASGSAPPPPPPTPPPPDEPEDVASLWARLETLPPRQRQETIASLDPEIMDQLEDWLMARIAKKKADADAKGKA
eukprot:TRINITY_DN13703_c0_g1_i1.p1 TRINITY_DN13703_c0_g1~~TRINITY_DN13703_c0_g1_i1.p1  ORF type:complete len:475 (-),score=105.39 TRINITY_DN13703_c0_g1_i1:66-1304(-)